jgi:hypothetical protein
MKSWTLVDTATDVFHSTFEPPAGALPAGCRLSLTTLAGGLRDGVQTIVLDAGGLSLQILPTRGMGVWKGSYKGLDLSWRAPLGGPVHPKFVPVEQPDGLGWLWGFDELVARCGLESNGAPDFDEQGRLKYPLHGRISNIPAHKVIVGFDEASHELVVSGEVDERRLHFAKLRLRTTYRVKVGSQRVDVVDEIVNLSGAPGECQMLYHVNFGPPVCAPGSRVLAPVETIVARTKHAAEHIGHWEDFGPARPGFEEQVYFYRLHADANENTSALLQAPDKKSGVSLHWSRKELPFFTLWKNSVAFEDGYVAGIEPGTNFPNPRSFESKQGRTVTLAPGGIHRVAWSIEVHPDAQAVAVAEKRIESLRGGRAPEILMSKQGWTMPQTPE